MTVLVTGGTGFIGSHLVDELLDEGYTIHVLVREHSARDYLQGKNINIKIGDIGDKKSLLKATKDVDTVFHVAALASEWGFWKLFFTINVQGTQNILDACVENRVEKIVHMSSAAVYGFPKTTTFITEEHPFHPYGNYGRSKYLAENILWEYQNKEGLSVSTIRTPMVTGSRDRMVAPSIINALRNKKFFFIGSGDQQLSISNGKDIARCLRLAGEKEKANGEAFNVKSFDCTIKELIRSLCARLGISQPRKHISYALALSIASLLEGGSKFLLKKKSPPLTKYKVAVLGHTRLIDCSKAKRDLGYFPKFSLESTIDDMLSI